MVEELVRVNVLAPVVKIPLLNDNTPEIEMLFVSVMPAALLIARSLNVVDEVPPIVWADMPVKLTVPVPAVNVPPFLVQFPATVKVDDPPIRVPVVIVTVPERE